MDYYEKRSRALQDIAELLSKKTSIKKIYYIVGVNYGFGPKVIDKMIEVIKNGV